MINIDWIASTEIVLARWKRRVGVPKCTVIFCSAVASLNNQSSHPSRPNWDQKGFWCEGERIVTGDECVARRVKEHLSITFSLDQERELVVRDMELEF